MYKKSLCAQLICLVIGLFFVTIAFAQDTVLEKRHRLSRVISELERLRGEAVEKIKDADIQICNTENTIRKCEKLRLLIKKEDSKTEGTIRQALDTAQKAKIKAQKVKRIAELEKLRAEKGIARVRMSLASLSSVDVEIKSIVNNYSGEAECFSKRENEWRPLEKDRAGYLEAGDSVRTGHNGKVEAYFLDGKGILRLGPNSVFTLNNEDAKIIEFFKGNIQFETIMPFKVRTTNFVVAVRGTEFLLSEVEGKGTELIVFEGIVELSDLKGRKTVIVNAGYKAEVPANGIFLEPYKIDLTKIQRWWEETQD